MADDSNKTEVASTEPTKEKKAEKRQEALSKIGKGLGFAQDLANIGSQMSANKAWKDVAGSALTDSKTASTYATAAENQKKEDNTFNLDSFDEMDTSKMQGIGPVAPDSPKFKGYEAHLKKRNKKKKNKESY